MTRFNYYALYGTIVGRLVKAESCLATELYQTLMHKSDNLESEVTVPQDFEDMRGYDGKTSKTNITDRFSFKFDNQIVREESFDQ